jgi:predicted small lipoprotein YifL
MRSSNHSARGIRTLLVLVVVAGLAACGNAVPSSAPSATPRPTPVITPDPHLTEPATADAIFGAIRVGQLPLAVNNATAGDPNSPVVKRINADIGNWPLIITQFRTSELLRETMKWDPAKPPAQGNAPYTFVGLNIVIEFGPTTGVLATPDASRQEQAERLVALVDPLLWPLEQRSVAPLPTKTAAATSGDPSPATAAAASPKP